MRSLLEELGQVSDSGDDSLKVTRNGHVLVLPSLEGNKTEATGELIALRHFLKRSENPLHNFNGREAHLLLVIGQNEARLFRADVYGGFPEQIFLSEPKVDLTIAVPASAKESDAGTPFDLIAQALGTTGKILIFGE